MDRMDKTTKLKEKTSEKSQFLGGFGDENLVEEYYFSKNNKLRPSTVLSENDKAYKVEVGIPFMSKEDLQFDIFQDRFVVTGKRKMNDPKNKERLYKAIFHIADDVNKEGIEADFNDGMLTIHFPKQKIRGEHGEAVL